MYPRVSVNVPSGNAVDTDHTPPEIEGIPVDELVLIPVPPCAAEPAATEVESAVAVEFE
jgi:hypothetical protein